MERIRVDFQLRASPKDSLGKGKLGILPLRIRTECRASKRSTFKIAI